MAKAVSRYEAGAYGFSFDRSLAPCFNFGACGASGARMALPVRRLQ